MQKDLRLRMLDPGLLPSDKRDLLTRITAQAAAINMSCYIVGGFVRDLLLGRPVTDFDFVVEGDAINLGNELVKKYGGKLIAHQKFHTCIWHLPESWNPSTSLTVRAASSGGTPVRDGRTSLTPDTLDIITARSESYEFPGALPNVKPSTIQDDIRRRDFTVNAMALRLDGDHFGELLDLLNAQNDLKQGLIRVLYPSSFVDDPTRILRAIRYEQRYGFKIEPDTLKLIDREALAVLSRLSGQRLRNEFDLILREENSGRLLLRAHKLGIFGAFKPELPKFDKKYTGLMNSVPSDDFGISPNRVLLGYLLWLIDSTPDILSQISKRLDFSSELTDTSLAILQLKTDLSSLKGSRPSAWTIRLDKAPAMAIYALWLVTSEPGLKEYLTKWRQVKPHFTGDDLKQRGLPPGPRYKEILYRLRAAWLDGEVTSEDDELSLLDKLIDPDPAN